MKRRSFLPALLVALFLFLGCDYDCPYCKDTGKIEVTNCCSKCEGKGKTWIPIPPAQVTRDKKRYWGTCPDCDGTGGWWEETVDCPRCTK